uniref:Voltage-dependent calcium channel alpha-2/delta subunit conserved region domain-containing protein n=1 Tax=Poecilia reticulata TaxID=8081 RepID=A0A3P9NG65_POERE
MVKISRNSRDVCVLACFMFCYYCLCTVVMQWLEVRTATSMKYSLPPFFFQPFSMVKWLLTELVIFLLEFNLYSWWNVDLSVKAQRPHGKTMMVPCDTEYPAFVSERTIKETTGSIDCNGCVSSFVIQQIPSSNLFMVVVDNKCDCNNIDPVTMDPIEIKYNESLKCDRLKLQKDRKKPESCHPFHPEENAMECGSASRLSVCLAVNLLPLIAATVSR